MLYTTGIKLIVHDQDTSGLDDLADRYIKCLREISRRIFHDIYVPRNGIKTTHIKSKNKATGEKALNSVCKTKYKDIFDSYDIPDIIRWSIAEMALNRYAGRDTRHKGQQSRPSTFKDKRGICFTHNSVVVYDAITQTIAVPLHDIPKGEKRYTRTPYKIQIPSNMQKYAPYLSSKFGCVLSFHKKWIFTVKINAPLLNLKYEPTGVLGYDLGLRRFMVLSSPIDGSITIEKPPTVKQLEVQLKELNATINKKHSDGLKSSQRRHFRKRVRNLLRKHKNTLKPLASKIVDHAEANKMLVALDTAAYGKKHGEKGQEITSVIRQQCRKRGIPYYEVPSWFTSQTCHKCDYKNSNNRNQKTNEFTCGKCGMTMDADDNAALYIAKLAWKGYHKTLEGAGNTHP